MKKTIATLLSLLIVLSLAACGSQTDSVGKLDEDKQQTEQIDSTQQNETDAAQEAEQPETSVQEEAVIYTLDTVPKPFGKTELPEGDTWDDHTFYSRSSQQDTQPLEDYMALLTAESFTVSEFEQNVGSSGYLSYIAEATHGNARVEMTVRPYLFMDGESYGFYYYTSEADIDENTLYELFVDIYVK